MPTNQQRREAAKRKLERQMVARAQRAKRRRIVTTAVTIGAVVVVVGLVYLLVVLNKGSDSAASQPTDTPTSSEAPPAPLTNGPCKYASTPNQPAAKQVNPPPDVDPTPNTGTAKVLLKTSQGDIPVTIDRSKAPCTAQAIESLVKAKYFDGTPCHRMTTADAGISVLQCGDPTGQGTGGPGFAIKDELPTNLKPVDGKQGYVTYPKGTLAMANSGPNTNGSQFFMVYGDSTLEPNYTVFGTIDPAGMETLAKIAAAGITPGDRGPADGAPKNPVTITTATES